MTDIKTESRLYWLGWLLSGLAIIALLADAAVNLFAVDMLRATMAEEGFPVRLAPTLGILILVCATLYAIPRTAFLGAILITGFLGGAICVHVRIGALGSPPQIISLLLGILAWGGLYLRDARVRALLPMRAAG